MISRLSALLIAATIMASTVLAAPQQNSFSVDKCGNNDVKCCDNLQQVKDSKDTSTAGLLSLLADIGANVGIDCTTINVIALANPGAACNSQPVCCDGVNQNGLVNVACTPIAVQA